MICNVLLMIDRLREFKLNYSAKKNYVDCRYIFSKFADFKNSSLRSRLYAYFADPADINADLPPWGYIQKFIILLLPIFPIHRFSKFLNLAQKKFWNIRQTLLKNGKIIAQVTQLINQGGRASFERDF